MAKMLLCYNGNHEIFARPTEEMVRLSKKHAAMMFNTNLGGLDDVCGNIDDFHKAYFIDGAKFDILGLTQTADLLKSEKISNKDVVTNIHPATMHVLINNVPHCLSIFNVGCYSSFGKRVGKNGEMYGYVTRHYLGMAVNDEEQMPLFVGEVGVKIRYNIETGTTEVHADKVPEGVKFVGVQLILTRELAEEVA